MSGKHAKSVFFYQGMYIINVFHVILYITIYFDQTRLCMVIVVNRRCDVSNAISSKISMDRKLAWVENCTGNCISDSNSVAMLDHFEIIKLLQSIIHRWKGLLLRYIMVSVVWLYVN